MTEIFDISWTFNEEMTTYKDDPAKKVKITKVKPESSEFNIAINSHSGTHVDAPIHFVSNGKTIDQVQLDTHIGECTVIELLDVNYIKKDNLLDKKIEAEKIIIFKTKNSEKSETELFNKDFVYVDKSAAEYLVEKKVKAVGIDYLGIETKQPNHETHILLLSNNIGIIEGLRLKNIKEGNYFFVGAPLKIKNCDAAPCRAVLIRF